MEQNSQSDNNKKIEYISKQDLPNSTATLVLGIISIASFWCYGIIGIVTGIIALSISGTSKRLYKENPGKYSESSYKNLNAGRISAIIGLVLSGFGILLIIFYLLILGVAFAGLHM